MKFKLDVEIKPFMVPRYVCFEGEGEPTNIHISELPNETVTELLNTFCQEVRDIVNKKKE